MRTPITGLIALGVLAFVAAPLAQVPPPPTPPVPAPAPGQSRIIQRVIVKVNGEIFTQTQLERRQIIALDEMRRKVDPKQLQEDATLMPLLMEVTPDILVDAVDQLLLVQHGRELGYRLSDERFKNAVEEFKKNNKLDDAQLKAALIEEGLTMETWRDMMEQGSIIADVQREEIGQKVPLTDQELRQYYATHPDEFKTAATVTLREILIAVATESRGGQQVVSAAAQEAAKAKADAVYARLKAGEEFAKVAAEMSESPTKANGGMLGTFNLAEVDPNLKKLIDLLKPGQSTEPIFTQRGFQILGLDTRSDPQVRPFDQVRDDIRQKLYGERLDAETRKFLTRIRTLAVIEWRDEGLKKMYEKRLAERTAMGR